MNLKLQELSFTIITQDLKPAIINPGVLQYVGIIPAGWELVENPIYNERELKLIFNNQVRLMIQPNRIFLAETIGTKTIQDIQIVEIIDNFLEVFTRVDYQGVSIAPSGYAAFSSDIEAKQYMTQNLLPDRPWQKFDRQSTNAVGLKLSYPHKSGNFYLDINQANIEIGNRNTAAVWFAGNYSYRLIGNNNSEKLEHLKQLVAKWKVDVSKFYRFVEQKFLASLVDPDRSVFPSTSQSN